MPVSRSATLLSPARPVLLAGSCFSDNLARRMKQSLWLACHSLGVLYNPLSIAKALRMALLDMDGGMQEFSDSLFEDSSGIWHSHLFSSVMSARKPEMARNLYAAMSGRMRECAADAGALVVTFGTAVCYYLADRRDYVAGNCHKQPSGAYVRRRLDISEIADTWIRLLQEIHARYPRMRVIFTVSPVRHLKDGFEENARSKATLLLAVESICRADEAAEYFPAYEIMQDDLRDYRFYGPDLAHPSEEAVEYIWTHFKDTYLDEAGKSMLREGASIYGSWHHRPNMRLLTAEDESMEAERKERVKNRYLDFRKRHGPLVAPLWSEE